MKHLKISLHFWYSELNGFDNFDNFDIIGSAIFCPTNAESMLSLYKLERIITLPMTIDRWL